MSVRYARPRGIGAAGAEDPGGLVQVEEPFPEPMLQATTVELVDGLVASSVAGRGHLAHSPDPARYDATHAHADLLVVGAGPAGLAAALTAAQAGARVVLLDEQADERQHAAGHHRPPRQRTRAGVGRRSDRRAGERARRAAPAAHHRVRPLRRRLRTGPGAPHRPVEQRSTERLRQRVWRIRTRHVLIATGAHERPVVYPDNDRPGIMLAGCGAHVPAPLRRARRPRGGGVHHRRRPPTPRQPTSPTRASGSPPVVDARPSAPPDLRAACAGARDPGARENQVVDGHGPASSGGGAALVGRRTGATATCCWSAAAGTPRCTCASQAGGTLRYDEGARRVPAGRAAARDQRRGRRERHPRPGRLPRRGRPGRGCGGSGSIPPLSPTDPRPEREPARGCSGGCPAMTARPVRRRPARRHRRRHRAGRRGRDAPVEHVKRYTTIGTAHDQGKTSGVIAAGITAELLGVPVAELGTTTFRAPYTPVAFAALAGRHRGAMYDPERTTPIHDWHVTRGAVFEDVGQWKRPRYSPWPARTWTPRCCASAAPRASRCRDHGRLDARQDRRGRPGRGRAARPALHQPVMSGLQGRAGALRAAVPRRRDGARRRHRDAAGRGPLPGLPPRPAARPTVLDWMEEWLQTEWPDLRVHLHLGDRALGDGRRWPGPHSRDVITRRLPPRSTPPPTAFGVHDLAGHRASAACRSRLARISFSGELAFEVNVDAWHGSRRLGPALAAGEPHGITPYGTETMHVLRAEKGYPIVGQDTDGTVTPQDLGMDWLVSANKADFVGKRSFTRPANRGPAAQAPRRPAAPTTRRLLLPEGAQIVADRGATRAAGPHARPRHLQLPQRRARPDLRAGPGPAAGATASGRGCTCPSAGGRCRSPSPAGVRRPEGARRDG